MDELLEKLGNVTALVFDEYGRICRGEKNFDFNTYAILLFEASVYAQISQECDMDEIDGLMELVEPLVDINDELNMALLDYDGEDLMKKRIYNKLENLLQVDNMISGSEYIEDIAEGFDDELVEEGRIYFDGYLELLAFGIKYMDVAYQLYKDGFKDQAYRLAFLNPFVEESLKANKGKFEKYNESDRTLLDDLLPISEMALGHASAEIEMTAASYIELYFKGKPKKNPLYHDYAMSLLVAMPAEDQFNIAAEYCGYYEDGSITKKQYHKYRSLILEADDARIKQNN